MSFSKNSGNALSLLLLLLFRKGVREHMSNHAQTTSDIFVCVLRLILFALSLSLSALFYYYFLRIYTREKKNAREEEEANQPERTFFLFPFDGGM